ncbi:MAG: sulfotransferase domain-containing protein [Acidimicrobiia bacterium]
MTGGHVRYTSPDEDSARWDGFPRRDGDIVISTRTKHGTTWMQNICALLIFRTTELPAPIADLSPWLDWTTRPQDEVWELLAAQTHRRFVKTHTPLDGIPIDPQVTYVVVARHPLDAAVSLYHQQLNLDRVRWAALTGNDAPDPSRPVPSLHDSLLAWIELDLDPREYLDNLPGVAWHLTDAWTRRAEPNVVLVHYDELQADLDGAMRRIAARLGIAVDEAVWPELVAAARFDAMRDRASDAVPERAGVIRDHARFFRAGVSGARFAELGAGEIARYEEQMARFTAPDVRAWMHGEVPSPG